MATNVDKEPIHFGLKLPTLKELSLIRIARRILYSKKGSPTESTLPSLLPLPGPLIKQVLPVVNYVSSQIVNWLDSFVISNYTFDLTMSRCNLELANLVIHGVETIPVYHKKVDKLEMDTFEEWPDRIFKEYIAKDRIIWSSYGTVDQQQMSQMLLHDDTIPVHDRFIISCHLCLEEEVQRLWEQIKGENFEFKSSLVRYWVHRMLGKIYDHRSHEDIPKIDTIRRISDCVDEFFIELLRNSPAIGFQYKWFWPRLDDAAKVRQLELYKDEEILFSQYAFFLLNQLNREHQQEFILSTAYEDHDAPEYSDFSNICLKSFLQRQLQHLFFPALELVMDKKNYALKVNQAGLAKILIENAYRLNGNQCDEEMIERLEATYAELHEKYIKEVGELKFLGTWGECECVYQ